jgi:hypothetical protein
VSACRRWAREETYRRVGVGAYRRWAYGHMPLPEQARGSAPADTPYADPFPRLPEIFGWQPRGAGYADPPLRRSVSPCP